MASALLSFSARIASTIRVSPTLKQAQIVSPLSV